MLKCKYTDGFDRSPTEVAMLFQADHPNADAKDFLLKLGLTEAEADEAIAAIPTPAPTPEPAPEPDPAPPADPPGQADPDPDPIPDPPDQSVRPAKSAPRGDWESYAVAIGAMDAETAKGYGSKKDLQAALPEE